MKITVTIDNHVHQARVPYESAEYVHVRGFAKCPRCGEDQEGEPLHVRGTGKRIESRDTYVTDAIVMCCRRPVGIMRVKVDTLFGIEEDENVFREAERHGWKVY